MINTTVATTSSSKVNFAKGNSQLRRATLALFGLLIIAAGSLYTIFTISDNEPTTDAISALILIVTLVTVVSSCVALFEQRLLKSASLLISGTLVLAILSGTTKSLVPLFKEPSSLVSDTIINTNLNFFAIGSTLAAVFAAIALTIGTTWKYSSAVKTAQYTATAATFILTIPVSLLAILEARAGLPDQNILATLNYVSFFKDTNVWFAAALILLPVFLAACAAGSYQSEKWLRVLTITTLPIVGGLALIAAGTTTITIVAAVPAIISWVALFFLHKPSGVKEKSFRTTTI